MSLLGSENILNATDYSALLQQAQSHLPQDLLWLQTLRQATLEKFLQAGFPSRRQENWKYTDLTFLAKQTWALAPPSELDTVPAALNDFAQRLVFVDGYFAPTLSTHNQLDAQISLLPLSLALAQYPEKIKPYLNHTFAADKATLADLNTALFTDGMVLWVPRDTTLVQPLHLLFLASSPHETSLCSLRNIVIVEENSSVTLIEQHSAVLNQHLKQDVSHYKNMVTQIAVAKGAKLSLYKIQDEADTTVHTALTDIQQDENSHVSSYSISLGAKLARDDLDFSLQATGAQCQLHGLYTISGRQHIDHHTRIDHRSEHCTSNEYYKGVLSDHATGVFNGKVIVHPFAQHTKSQQTNKNMLLSQGAEMNTKPELEIYADNVQCTHGATVGQIDEEALFYLRSRGLDMDTATALLTRAFINDVLEQIEEPPIAEYVRRFLK